MGTSPRGRAASQAPGWACYKLGPQNYPYPFTSAFDSRVDWHILVDQHKTERYTSLLNRLQACLSAGHEP